MQDPDERFIPEHLSFDAAAERYENAPGFLDEAIDALTGAPEADIPLKLQEALTQWYRKTKTYELSVQYVIEEAEKP